jgi:hypothetical protein
MYMYMYEPVAKVHILAKRVCHRKSWKRKESKDHEVTGQRRELSFSFERIFHGPYWSHLTAPPGQVDSQQPKDQRPPRQGRGISFMLQITACAGQRFICGDIRPTLDLCRR